MAISQLHPLEIDERTGEPFLRLPPPHNNIIITPPRLTDAPELTNILSEPAIYTWLSSAPRPCTQEHAEARLLRLKGRLEELMKEIKELEEAFPDGPLQWVSGCPVNALREVKEDGTQVYIGDIGMRRDRFMHAGEGEFGEGDEQRRLEAENAALPNGDENILWSMGDFLSTPYHGRGIISAAIATLFREWYIPRMNVHHVRVEAFAGNGASVRVFQKNGFVVDPEVRKVDHVNAAGIRHTGMHVMIWDRK
ncbi:hypothetical protein BXZ70DRAFT_200555 [Cristinia sonorae]|uniref:N-acetyltransferase domain-containing protein n=1 Tax=Cristinia sonorae TaxID=1940300 RepID=A0A8K0UNA0_9AGAR|nr:hypothetical protein BXZ70DRAFT_200555 [Cristinia sonorae]